MLEWAFIIYGLGFAVFASAPEHYDLVAPGQWRPWLVIAALWPIVVVVGFFFLLSTREMRAAIGLLNKNH
jgi:hypothetical protein